MPLSGSENVLPQEIRIAKDHIKVLYKKKLVSGNSLQIPVSENHACLSWTQKVRYELSKPDVSKYSDLVMCMFCASGA